jgi:hypothetical protein
MELFATIRGETIVALPEFWTFDQVRSQVASQELQEARVRRPDGEGCPLHPVVIHRDPTEPLEFLLSGSQLAKIVNHGPSSCCS